MKISKFLLIISVLFLTTGCYAEITGTVIDAETGEPIEGAVVLVEWTKKHGLGLTYTESYKVIEAVTDKDGKITVSGVFSPFVNPPNVTVYKKGYVAWNNKFIFPNYEKRKDFKWSDNLTIQMVRFDERKYTYNDHIMFVHGSINYGLPNNNKKIMEESIRWEQLKALEERQKAK